MGFFPGDIKLGSNWKNLGIDGGRGINPKYVVSVP